MRSCATRSTNLNGPEHTGFAPNLSPAACAALGDTIMPARSASCASSGENGADRLSRAVIGSTTSTLVTSASSPRRLRALHRLVALDVELDRGGVELLAVVERHARPHLDRQRLAVGRPRVALGELRHDVELLVDVEQLVAQRREHDAADERARERRDRARPDPRRARSAGLRARAARSRATVASERDSEDRSVHECRVSWRILLSASGGIDD